MLDPMSHVEKRPKGKIINNSFDDVDNAESDDEIT